MELHTQRVGTYTFESTNELGCTHTATLNLTINNSSSSSEDVIITDSSYGGTVQLIQKVVFIHLIQLMIMDVCMYQH